MGTARRAPTIDNDGITKIMTDQTPPPCDLPPQRNTPNLRQLLLWLGLAAVLLALVWQTGGLHMVLLYLIGLALGFAFLHSAFGFAGAYRRFILDRDARLVNGQLLLLALTGILFAPLFAQGEWMGLELSPASAPVSVSVAIGAFMFGIGMQLSGGCGSGTLFALGSGNLRMGIVLLAFCGGAFWGSLDLYKWEALPGVDEIVLGDQLGWFGATLLQIAALALIWLMVRRAAREQPAQPVRRYHLWRGPWPLWAGITAIALLSVLTLLIAGHPWSITWAFSLWAAKAAALLGWNPASSDFWQGDFQTYALAHSVLQDETSVMDFGAMLGAAIAASLAGKMRMNLNFAWRPVLAALLGGLAMGYGARLAYGCNIGALYSGIASTSVHGWLWLAAALPGVWIGVKLRPLFNLQR